MKFLKPDGIPVICPDEVLTVSLVTAGSWGISTLMGLLLWQTQFSPFSLGITAIWLRQTHRSVRSETKLKFEHL